MLNSRMIGNKITEARKKLNISQALLAERLFISPQAVGKWERGESMPDIITFVRLSEILGVDLNYFSENFSVPAAIRTIESGESTIKQSAEAPSGEQDLPARPHDQVGLDGKTGNKPGWDMSHGNWVDADFSGLKNLHDKFSSSNLQRCLFIGSDISGLLLKGNNVDRCDFSNSDISSSHIQSSNLANNLFKYCSLKETVFSGSYILGCDFSGADFTGTAFTSGGFQKNQMAGAVLNRTSFNAMQIADMVFEGTLEDCYFENCSFSKVIFQNTTLINTFFKNKSLKRIRFIECKADKLTYAFLKNGKADLTGIILLTE